MRRALWDDCPDEQQVREMEEILASDTEEVFFAERPERRAVRLPGGGAPLQGRRLRLDAGRLHRGLVRR